MRYRQHVTLTTADMGVTQIDLLLLAKKGNIKTGGKHIMWLIIKKIILVHVQVILKIQIYSSFLLLLTDKFPFLVQETR